MALTSSTDDGFREIQLSGKQLVFLFMAVTVVLVVTFLTGVLVGRGVRAERAEAAQAEVLNEAPIEPARASVVPPADVDPTRAAPPATADDAPDTDATSKTPAAPAEEAPMAVVRRESPPPQPKTMDTARATPPPAARPAAAPAPAAAAPAPAAAEAPATAITPAAASVRNGYAVQVAATNARGEADSIVKRLSGKGYSAYIEDPKGRQKMFRVRVGTFKTRREAQTVADRLKKEEKFKPWVTR
ncbi:MAG TPA: SPOR domain-containing protein [Vicinamibacterales bacterium]|nr:SPOR domain-containing protein [Vicinamibacterales bacterium]